MSSGTKNRKSAVARSAFANQRVSTCASDPDIDDIADAFPPALGEVHYAVVFPPTLPVIGVAPAVAVDQHRNIAAHEFLVEL